MDLRKVLKEQGIALLMLMGFFGYLFFGCVLERMLGLS